MSKIKVSAEVMADVAKRLPVDAFNPTGEILNTKYNVTGVVIRTLDNDVKTFNVILETAERKLNVPAGVLKRARVLSSDKKFAGKWNKHEFTVLRSENEGIINDSRFLHEVLKMEEGKELALPENMTLAGIVINDINGEARVSSFQYEGFREAWQEAVAADAPFSFAKFEETLKANNKKLKTIASYDENRISHHDYTLIFKDVVADGE
jgi:hypothetical protein